MFFSILFNRFYSTTSLLTPLYSLGFWAGIFLTIQLVSGFILACHYQPSSNFAFLSVDLISSDLDSGCILSSFHANGASFFMFCVYCHMFSCMWFFSFSSNPVVWFFGVVIYLLLCAACFTGYSLVFGQMSLWAIVVICSLFTAIPFIGTNILSLLWGSSTVCSSTINSFFCLHFILPLVLFCWVAVHLFELHRVNSSGDVGFLCSTFDRVMFYSVYLVSDCFIGSFMFCFYGYYVFFDSDAFGHPDNFVFANPMVTPALIAPEWYFLPFYGVISSIPHNSFGIVIMFLFVVWLFTFGDFGLSFNSFLIYSLLVRSNLLCFFVDLVVCSVIWLMVNHAESLYLLLCFSVLCLFFSELYFSSLSRLVGSFSFEFLSFFSFVNCWRFDYGGSNSVLSFFLPNSVCFFVTFLGWVFHLFNFHYFLFLFILLSALFWMVSFSVSLTFESFLFSSILSSVGTQTWFTWLLLFEIMFFVGAIWVFSVSSIHPLSEVGFNTADFFSSSPESTSGLDFCCCYDVWLSSFNTNHNFGFLTEFWLPVLINLLILLYVTLLIQFCHRLIQIF